MKDREKFNDEVLWDFHQTENAAHLEPANIRQDMLVRKIKSKLKSGKVLEIGFGNGYLLSKLSGQYDCYGADISAENMERARGKIKSVKFSLVGTDGKLPFEDGYFDAFVASEVLEHMSDEELQKSISEIKRILKPGGSAFITVPAEENLKDSECFCPNCHLKFHKWGHKQSWNRDRIRKEFKDFRINNISEYYNRFVGKSAFENLLGVMMQFIQATLNYFVSFPNKIYRNRNYVIVITKP